jgi:MFS superfamily sulfate permease-like transporter
VRLIPEWLRRYQSAWFRSDVVAGAMVGPVKIAPTLDGAVGNG